MSFDLSWVYKIVDRFTEPINRMNRATKKITRTMGIASHRVKRLGADFANLRTMIGTVAGIAAIAFPIKKAIDWESKMIDVKRVMTFKTPEEFEKFKESIFETAIHLGILPTKIGDIAYEGGKLNILNKNMLSFINLVARTSIAFDMTEKAAGTAIGSIRAKLGFTTEKTGVLMDAMNKLADNTATTGDRILNVVQRTVGSMKTIKMPPELIAGWSAFADQLEFSPELAASGFNMMTAKMMQMPGMMKKLLKDPSSAIKGMLTKFAEMPELRRSTKIFKKFGRNAGKFVLKAVGSLDLLDSTLSHVAKKSNFLGSMLKELQKKLEGTETAIGRIKAVSDFAFITLGNAFLPIIKEFTPAIINMVKSIRQFILTNPAIVKIGMAFIGMATILTGVAIIIGVISTAIGILLSPITLIVVAVAAVAIGFLWLYKKSEKVRNAVGRLFVAFQPIIDAVKELINEFGGMESILENVFIVLETVAVFYINLMTEMIKALIVDVKFVYNLIKGGANFISGFFPERIKVIQETIKATQDEDFVPKNATIKFDAILNPLKNIIQKKNFAFDPIMKGVSIPKLENKIPNVNYETATNYLFNEYGKPKTQMKNSISAQNAAMKLQINGMIKVISDKGSKVEYATIDHSPSGNIGLNMVPE